MSNRLGVADYIRRAFLARDKASADAIIKDAEEEFPPKKNGNGNGDDHTEPDGDEGENAHAGNKGGVHVHIEHGGDKSADGLGSRVTKLEDSLKSMDAKLGKVLDHLGVNDQFEKKDDDKDDDEKKDKTEDQPSGTPEGTGTMPGMTATGPASAAPELMEADPALNTGPSKMGDAAYKDPQWLAQAEQTLRAVMAETAQRAEVLSPGIKMPTLDANFGVHTASPVLCGVRRAALTKALQDPSKRAVISGHVTPDSIKSMSCEAVTLAFKDASDSVRAANNAKGKPTGGVWFPDQQGNRTAWQIQHDRLAAINAAHREGWAKIGGAGPFGVH